MTLIQLNSSNILSCNNNIKGFTKGLVADVELANSNVGDLDIVILPDNTVCVAVQTKYDRYVNMPKPSNGGQMVRICVVAASDSIKINQ